MSPFVVDDVVVDVIVMRCVIYGVDVVVFGTAVGVKSGVVTIVVYSDDV